MAMPLCMRSIVTPAFTQTRPLLSSRGLTQIQGSRRHRSVHIIRAASNSEDTIGTLGTAAVASGALANPLVLLSDYVLFSTGRGLPEGPGGLYGAAEGVSYLVVLGIVGWSIATKINTGKGLPAGPAGALGAIEGFSYLTLVISVGVFALQLIQKGSLPGVTG